jgi:hypothetical protein
MKKSDPTLVVSVAQTIKGQAIDFSSLNEDGPIKLVRGKKTKIEPCRVIAGKPVYHIAKNEIPWEGVEFNIRKVQKWGQLFHPCLVPASYEIGGTIKLYTDTRISGQILMWGVTCIEDYGDGFCGREYDLLAWTPKIGKESANSAGERLFHAIFLEIQFVKENEWISDPNLSEVFDGSPNVMEIVRMVSPEKN